MHTKESVKKSFKLPRRNADNDRVLAYLERRGINRAMAQDCINKDLLYESAAWHNAVFVGRDESGKARYATVRGTADEKTGTAPFRRDVESSDKSCGFRLFLGGTALAALTRFLETHRDVENIIICTDNDAAGNLAAEKIAEIPGYHITRELPPNDAKDWNDALLSIKNRVKESKITREVEEMKKMEDVRKDILFLAEPFTYPEAFRIKDGDSVKVTYAYDGEVAILKCRFIDETHLTIGSNSYHISELAEKLKKNGNKIEPIPNQKPMLNILAAAYGEPLKDVEIPMTDAAIRKLVDGPYKMEAVRGDHIILCGVDGVAVFKMEYDAFTSVHPYWAQTLKSGLGIIEPRVIELPDGGRAIPKKADMMKKIDKFKAKAATQTVMPPAHDKGRNDTAL